MSLGWNSTRILQMASMVGMVQVNLVQLVQQLSTDVRITPGFPFSVMISQEISFAAAIQLKLP